MVDSHGRFVWYELATTNVEAAKAFYAEVVGWGTQDASLLGLPYTRFTAGEASVGGLMQLLIDLRTGDTIHWVRVEGMVSELYDVVVLPGITRPTLFGFKSDEIQRTISIGDPGTL